MPRLCGVCTHRERDQIDHAILRGESDELIAGRFGNLSRQSVQRHGARHLPEALRTAFAAEQTRKGRTLLDRVERHADRLERLADEADGNGRVELLAVSRELTSALTLLGKATGEIQTGAQVQVNLLTAVWQRLGVKDEQELRQLVESGRKLDALTSEQFSHEQMFDDGLEVVALMLRDHPELYSRVEDRLGWAASAFRRDRGGGPAANGDRVP